MTGEDGGRDQSNASTSQGMAKNADCPQKLGERCGEVSWSELSDRSSSADTLISDF